MPDLISAALFERDERVLTAHRRPGRPPFAGSWLLPMTRVGANETAEAALGRHVREQFGVTVSGESFVDTVYIEDAAAKRRYVANVFRAQISGGPMRFRADGDYDDARWLALPELHVIPMPAELRDGVLRALTQTEPKEERDWTAIEAAMSAPAVPLAERAEEAAVEPEPAPDNRAGWDAIAAAYQDERYGDRHAGRLVWSRGVFEDELGLLGDVHGQRAIVLGCGGGQDAVALERMGARPVGVDISGAQIAYAKKYALRHGAENASFVEGSIDDLARFDDGSFDLAVSIHALAYVTNLERAFAEAARVLKPGGVLAISVPHPLNQVFGDDPPYAPARSYREETIDWTWELKDASARLRERTPMVSGWFGMMTDAGFTVERVVEPDQSGLTGDDAEGFDLARARLIPYAIIFKARKR
ncbi:MAG: methyltransferase domain-containing protein [Dehalococcoidia bacterium]